MKGPSTDPVAMTRIKCQRRRFTGRAADARLLQGLEENRGPSQSGRYAMSLTSCLWQRDLNAEARGTILQLQAATMQLNDSVDKAETKPVSWRAATAIQPVEATQNEILLILRNSRAVICNRHLPAIDPEDDLAAGGGVTQRILDQVRDDLPQKGPVTQDYGGPTKSNAQQMAAFFGGGLVELGYGCGQGG